jgi:uncharacterized protein (DUF2252 family)
LSRDERVALGKRARAIKPIEAHAVLDLRPDRDPIGMLLDQAQSRVPELVPVRHGRMLVSPFTFYRGAALPMAADLAISASTGLRVQLCGDAHLLNFGVFASPERTMVFDVNDFDETLPGPFEWDVKRLVASLAVAGRQNGFSNKDRRKVALAAGETYRTAMRDFADQSRMQVWYARLDIERTVRDLQSQVSAKRLARLEKDLSRAQTRDSMHDVSKLTRLVDGRRQIINDPPLIVAVEDLFGDVETDALYDEIGAVVDQYRRSLQSDRRRLLEQFTLAHMARKVVGVGSVGTRAWVILLDAGDDDEPLILQAKEAEDSVLSPFSGRSRYDNQGERVVAGQHLIQAQSDIFLGWTQVEGVDGARHDYYVRQLRDWKYSLPVDQVRPRGMTEYARLCGWTLARGHARSGDRVALSAYLGRSPRFENAMADFAEAYADQNEADYAAFQDAVKQGRVQATAGL